MDALQFEEMPDMRHPYLLLAYEGWSNAAGVATATGQFLIEHLQAKRFASIDPEEFYSFAEQRPQARYNDAGEREIIWPENDFYFCAQPQLDHDIIIATGVEPHLKWRTFTNTMIDFIKKCKVYQTVTLGALWADVLYSAPVPFSGSSTDPELAERLGLGGGSRYEGPTGMVGVFTRYAAPQQFDLGQCLGQHALLCLSHPESEGHLSPKPARHGDRWATDRFSRVGRRSQRF